MDKTDKLYEAYKRSSGVCTDTRRISEGCFFVALRGERFDANEMVGEALSQGAAYALTTNKDFEGDERAIVVDDTLKALQDLARTHRRHLKIPIVGITGTNGKTTTKELTTAVLSKKYKVLATVGNLNNHIGVPLTVLSIGDDTEIAVVEMGANHPGEIVALCEIAQPTAGLITNVGMAHLEGFGSFEGVKRTKAELYDYLRRTGGEVFVNTDSQDLSEMLGEYAAMGYGEKQTDKNAICGRACENETGYMSFEWRDGAKSGHTDTHLVGSYNVRNALAAMTVGKRFGVDMQSAAQAIADYVPSNGRSQLVRTSRNTLIVDAYNANLSSMTAAIDAFAGRKETSKMLILGSMRELGREQDACHRQILDKISSDVSMDAVLIGKEFGRFAEEYPKYKFFESTEQAIETCKQTSGKVILLKGSNSYKMSSLVEYL